MSTPAELPHLPWIARLERGSLYVLVTGKDQELRFEKGIALPVSDAVRDHLEANATERRVVFHDPDEDEVEIVERCSFSFEPNEETAP